MPPTLRVAHRLMLLRYLMYAGVGITGVAGWNSLAGQVRPEPLPVTIATLPVTPHTLQEPRVTLDVENMPIQDVLYKIVNQAKLALSWSDAKVPLKGSVTLQVKDIPVSQALALALKNQGAEARMSLEGRTVLIVRKDSASRNDASQGTGTISGFVTDSASGEGIAGVTVAIQGTKLSVITDSKGAYTLLTVPAGEHQVTFKYLGYTSATHTVRVDDQKRTAVNVVLKQAANILSGVVTTATGERRKVEVGHSVVSLNVDSLRQVAPITSVTDLLESRVPGMTIQRTSGTPGDPARIRLRGTGSLYENNDPIIVVDNVRMYSRQSDDRNINQSGGGRSYATPSPLDQIDPSMIEKIEILKGPSASALYGADAANGVIVITTKRGQAGPPVWNVDMDLGRTYQPGSWPTSRYQWITPQVGGVPTLCIGFCGDAQVDSVVYFQALNNPYLTALGTGSLFQSSVNVSGGSPIVTYNLNANIGRERGLLKLPEIEVDRYRRFQNEPVPGWMQRPDLLEKRGVQGKITVQLTPRMSVMATTNLNQQVQHRTSTSDNANSAISQLQRLWIDLSQLDERPVLGNPYERVTTEIVNLRNSVQLMAQPASWLPVTVDFGSNSMVTNAEMRIARGLLTDSESGGAFRGETRSSSELTGRLFSPIQALDRLKVTAGLDYARGRTNDQRGALFGIPLGVTDPSQGEDTLRNRFSRSSTERVSFGWYLEPMLIVSERFYLTPGFRLDNDGLSGKNAKFMGLPKMNFSWVISDEAFFPWKSLMQSVRLRTAFGVSGVSPSPDQLNRLYSLRTITPYGQEDPLYGEMLSLSTLGNTRLRPERSREIEGGIDVELWQSRLTLELTHWRKYTKDLIVSNAIAGSVDGGGNQRMNVGDIQRSGTEISMFAQLIERRNLGFNVNVNFDRKQSIVRRLNTQGETRFGTEYTLGGVRYVVGYPLDGVWMRPVLGYTDLDGDGWLKFSEVVFGPNAAYVGSTEPAYQMGIHPAMNLFGGRFRLAASFSYVSGQLQMLEARAFGSQVRGAYPFMSNVVIGAQGFDRQVAYLGWSHIRVGTLVGYTQKLNVTRWQSVSVSMTLAPKVVQWLRARHGSLSLQGSNLGLWTNYIGVDPNVNGALGSRGLADSGQQPEPRTWRLRVTMGY